MKASRFAAVCVPVVLASSVFAKDAPLAKDAASKDAVPVERPQVLDLRQEVNGVSYKITVRPGVGSPDKALTVSIELAEMLKSPDPTFGSRRPLDEAQVEGVLIANHKDKKKKAGPDWVDARRAVKLGDVGTFAMTFTPPSEGMYTLRIRGQEQRVGEFTHAIMIPVGVWPFPSDAELEAMPAKPPSATTGNLKNGRSLCDDYCSRNVEGAMPRGGTPTLLSSGMAAALDDNALLVTLLGDKLKKIGAVERADLLFYLRGLHVELRSLEPSTQLFMSKVFTINEHGRKRLQDSGFPVDDKSAKGTVFVLYKGEEQAQPKAVRFEDRVARDALKKANKLGYIVFIETGDPKMKELGFSLNKEPKYSISGIEARAESGKMDAELQKDFKAFAGTGSFNDPKSLNKGAPELRKKLLPYYLRAAELATMYLLDEREFTAFDDELN